jgi:hypothetical protein
VRLGRRNGRIAVRQPSDGRWVRYRYRYDSAPDILTLEYDSNAGGSGRLAVLIPGTQRVRGIERDGVAEVPAIETVGHDRYVVLDTDWRDRVLVVRLGAPLRSE